MTYPSFATGEVLTAADMNAVGLWRVTGCTVTSVGGTAATASNGVITIGTGNTSVTVNNAFSADYDNYRIIVSDVGGTNDISFQLQFVGYTANGYNGAFQFVNYTSNTAATASNNNAAAFSFVGATGTTGNNGGGFIDLMSPFDSTAWTRIVAQPITYQNISGSYTGFHGVTASHTGFILTPGAGTWTGGTIRVYGYRN